MSENKFIKHLRGENTAKSVLEIKNQKTPTSFGNMPEGSTSNANDVYSDHRGDAVGVLKGTENWKLNSSVLLETSSVYGDGRDFTDSFDIDGNTLWVNATHTFTTARRFAPNTKFVLKLCGHDLNTVVGDTIGFTLLVKFGTNNIISKVFNITEQAFDFCKEFVIDFGESNTSAIKVAAGSTMTVQLLCADPFASATIYNGMTVFTALQRRVDSETVSSDTLSLDEIEYDLTTHINNKDNPHEVTKAQIGLGNCDNTSDLDKPISTATQAALDGKVSTDGSSTMTGPLKMRATSSFQCAIAPFWDGVGFFKLNSDDSVTLIASIETPDGFVPWVTNTYNIGSSLKKWKNLYLSGTAYIAKINNGYDLLVPAKSGTLATKEEVDLAANSGRMILDQGVWYAKMYSATVAPSAEEGTNYADFSQVDQDDNPIIVIYERQSGAWVLSETITPPAEYDGYVPITSKIWDIAEQSGQQGGRVMWNHISKEFTPYPQIISFEDIEITGDSTVVMPNNPSANQIANKNYVDNSIGNGTITITQGGTTKGSFTTNQGNNTTIDIDAGGGGSGLNVGDIFSTMRNDNELNGAVECDGATYNTTDFTGAQSIGALLEAGKIDYVSLSAYADAITQKGWCDKIGWNGTGNTQFRVPTLNAYIWQKLQTGVVGTGTLKFQNGSYLDSHDESLGSAAGWVRTHNSGGAWASVGALSVSSNPSESNLVAGASTDISQQRVMIQLAVATTDEALETCTSVLADVATLKSNGLALPNYSAGISVANITPSTPYTAPADGFLYGDIYNCTVYVNGAQVGYADDPSYSYTMMIVLSQGDIVTVNQQRFGRANFYPCKK